jgi:PilZ domain
MTMPEDNRKLLRHAVQLPLVYRVPRGRVHHSEAGWTRDLSEGGIGLELPERLRQHTRLALRLGTALGVVWAEGEVVWVGLPSLPTGGTLHGIRLAEIHPAQQEKLEELLRALARAPHAASRLPLDLEVTCQPLEPVGPSLPGRTINVGRGGLGLLLPTALAPGTAVQLTLRPARHPLRVEGVIAWVEPEGRRLPPDTLIIHGLQFTALDWALARTLGALLMEVG